MIPTERVVSKLPSGAVDCHAHVMRKDRPIISTRHAPPEHDITPEDFLAVLEAHGVSNGVLTAPSFYGADNSLLLEALRAYPTRLRGTVIVDVDITLAQLESMQSAGVVGIRLNWFKRAQLPDVTTKEYQRLFSLVRALDWHVEIFLESERLQNILPAVQLSGVKVVLDHFACPDAKLGIEGPGFKRVLEALGQGNTWVKLSGPYRLLGADPQPFVQALRSAGGIDSLLWASDWPWVQHADGLTYQTCLDWLKVWVPDSDERQRVLVDTPAKLFGFK